MNIWAQIAIWIVGLGIHSLINFMLVVWIWSKSYSKNENGDSIIAKILYNERINHHSPDLPLKRVAFFGTMPIVGSIIVAVYWFIALYEGNVNLPNPTIWIAKIIFRKRYLLDKVGNEI